MLSRTPRLPSTTRGALITALACVGIASHAHATPDLRCTVEATPNPQQGTVTLAVTVKNEGSSAASASPGQQMVLVWADLDGAPTIADNPTMDWQLLLLQPGATDTSFVASDIGVGPGTFTAWCLVNPEIAAGLYYEPDETDFGDNLSSVVYTVDPPPPSVPDIRVVELTGVEDPSGEAFAVAFKVKLVNEGTEDAAPFDIDIYPDDELLPEDAAQSTIGCTVATGILAGGEIELDCGSYNGWGEADIGAQTVFVYADRLDTIGEIDRADNFHKGEVTVVGPPDLEAGELTVSSVGDTVTYELVVKNTGGEDVASAEVCFWYYSAPDGSTPPDSVVTLSVAVGANVVASAEQQGSPGGTFTAYAQIDCEGILTELDEANNDAEDSYTVVGVPNVPPVVSGTLLPTVCTETAECVFELVGDDTTSLPTAGLSWRTLEAPLGLQVFRPAGATKTDGRAIVRYVPPLGSSKEVVTVTVEAADLVSKTPFTFAFSVRPPPDFDGVVGATGSIPGSQKSGCPMIELPGIGFAQVDNDDDLVRVFAATGASPNLAKAQPARLLGLVALKADALWSCHIEPLATGGVALLELSSSNSTTTTVHLLQPGAFEPGAKPKTTARQVDLPPNIYADRFASTDGRTLAFLGVSTSPTVVFLDSTAGKLDESWGGNVKATAGGGKPGVLDLYAPAGGTLIANPGYLWAHPNGVRIYNEHFTRREFVDYDRTGTITVRSPIGTLIPPAPAIGTAPWTLFASADGGFQLVDDEEGTLEWYAPEPNDVVGAPVVFTPVPSFTLAAPGQPAKAGHVSLQSYGLAVSNVECAPLPAGGFTCHDVLERRGFVINALGTYWEACALVDLSPITLDFGAVSQGSRSRPLKITNLGGATLVLTDSSVSPISTPGGTFTDLPIKPTEPPVYLAPYESVTYDVTFSPKQSGASKGLLRLTGNSCATMTVTLVGHSGPRLHITPTSVDFVGVPTGVHTRSVTLTSTGSQDVNVTGVQLATPNGSLALSPGVVPAKVLPPGQSYTFQVKLDTQEPGSFKGELSILSNEPNQGVRKIPVTATTTARVTTVPSGFNFGAVAEGSSVLRTLTVTNSGHTPLTLDPPELVSGGGFKLDTSTFVSVLPPQASTTLTLRATGLPSTAPSTRAALVIITHDADAEPPIVLHAIAGNGTRFPAGFDGSLELMASDGGGFTGSIEPRAFVHLSTGGFAVTTANGDHILVTTAGGQPDPTFGSGGVIDLRAAFPQVTSTLDGLAELVDGGFALLDRPGRRIVTIRPDGSPHGYIGAGGLLSAPTGFPFNSAGATVGLAFGQVPKAGGAFVISELSTHTLVFTNRLGAVDTSYGNPFPNGNPGVWQFLATGVGDSVGLSDVAVVVPDPTTKAIFSLSVAGAQSAEPAKNVVASYSGSFAPTGGAKFLYHDPTNGTVTRHLTPLLGLDPSFGADGKVVLATTFGEVSPINSVASVGSGFAVLDYERRAILVGTESGEPFVATPKAVVVDLPASLDFGVVPVGTVSAPRPIAIDNKGKVDLVVTALFDPPAFRLAGGGSQLVVPPGETRDLGAVFAPATIGVFVGSLRITTNDAGFDATPHMVDLFGSTGPDLVIEPAAAVVDFGAASTAAPSERTFFVRNAGAEAVTIATPQVQGPGFSVASPFASLIFKPNTAAQAITLRFSPPSAGTFDGSLTLAPTDGSAALVTALRGRNSATLDVIPSAIACEGGAPGETQHCGTLRLRNGGSQALTVTSVTSNHPAFTLVGATGIHTLEPGAKALEFTVLATPGTDGVTSAQVEIAHTGAGPVAVPVSVTAGAALTAAPSTIDFTSVPVGSKAYRTVYVSGTGQVVAATLTGSAAVSIASAPALPSDALTPVAVEVGCAPTAPGVVTASLTIVTTATGTPGLVVPVRCVGGAALVADPLAVDFGGAAVGSTVTRAVVLSAVGGDVTITSVASTAGGPFAATPFAGTLRAGDSVPTFVSFTPAGLGPAAGELVVERAGGGPVVVSLGGRAGIAAAVASAALDFGLVAVGESAERAALVQNTGSQAIQLGAPALKQVGAFTIVPVDTSSVPVGATRPVAIRFTPQSIGEFEDTLTIPYDGGLLEVTLSGRAGAHLVVAPTHLDFGDVAAGQQASRTVTIRNTSASVPAAISAVLTGVSDAFAVSSLGAKTLAPGETRVLTVTFAPIAAGSFDGAYTVSTSAGVEAGNQQIALRGSSGARLILVDPPSRHLTFRSVPVGSAEARSIRLAAGPAADVHLLGYSLDGAREAFVLGGLEALPLTVPAGQATSSLQVACAPKQRGVYVGDLTIVSSAGTIRLGLVCNTPPLLDVSPRRVAFGASSAPVAQTLTFTNTGSAAVTVKGLFIGGAEAKAGFSASPATPNFAIAAGESVAVPVGFAPKAAGSYRDVLTISTDDPASDGIEVALEGSSGARLALEPHSLNLCRQTSSQDVVVENVGSAPLVIDSLGFAGGSADGFEWKWKTNSGTVSTVLAAGETRTLVVTFDGTLGAGKRVGGASIAFDSNDTEAPVLPIVAGLGYSPPDGFDGTADLLTPGEPAFTSVDVLDGGLSELCTGGLVAASLSEQRLLFVHPGSAGKAVRLSAWGSDGEVDLAALASDAGIPGALRGDFGVRVRSLSSATGLLGVLAPGAGQIVLMTHDGGIARSHPSGGVLDVDAAVGAVTRPVDIAPRGQGASGNPLSIVVLDAKAAELLAMTETGGLDSSFGDGGRISLLAAFPGGVSDGLMDLASPANDSYAVLDVGRAQVLVVKANGARDAAFGGGTGILNLDKDDELHRPGAAGLLAYSPGLALFDRIRDDVTVLTPVGLALESVGRSGLFEPLWAYPNGSAGRRGPLGHAFAVTTTAASAGDNAGQLVFVDQGGGDTLWVSSKGNPMAKGVPTLAVLGCPATIQLKKNQTSGAATLTLDNSGDQFLQVESVDAGLDVLTCTLGTSACDDGLPVGPDTNVEVTLAWAQPTLGCSDGVIRITHNGANGPVTECPIHLGTAGGFEVSPGGEAELNRYDFPALAVGSSFTKEFTIRNTGCAPLPLNSVVLGAGVNFALVQGAPGPVPAGGTYSFKVTCKPTEPGLHQDTLQFDVPGEDAPPIALRCATGPRLDHAPTTLTWHGTPVGAFDTELVTMTNTGGAPATLTGSAEQRFRITGGQFRAAGETTFSTLAPEVAAQVFSIGGAPEEASWAVGSSRTVAVTFGPLEAGTYRGNLEFTSDSHTSPSHVIPLEGTSAPEVYFAPSPADLGTVGPGASACIVVTVTNEGAEVAGYEPVPTSLTGTAFSLKKPEGGPDCDAPELTSLALLPGASTEFPVWCTPPTAGAFEAGLIVEADGDANAVDGILTLPLRCRGGRCLTVSVDEVAFDDTPWTSTSTAKVTLTNDSDAEITATLSIEGGAAAEFALAGSAEVKVAASTSTEVELLFDPVDSPGKRKATLTIADPACEPASHVVLLSGWSMPPDDAGEDVAPDSGGGDVAVTEDTSSEEDTTGSADTQTTTKPTAGIDAYDGCGCKAAGPRREVPPVAWLVLALVAAFGIRRRR